MTRFKKTSIVGIFGIGLGVIAFLTNPQKSSYQAYASETLKTQVKEQVCTQVKEEVGAWLEGQCHILIATASPFLAEVISQQTTRKNFLLFSIYQVDLPLPNPLPDYHVETLGILGNFYIYQAKKI
ncbi:MAG: DUF4359 domain-containing protein [Cyanobacteria bacterium P01_G01_bin.19]